MRKTAKIQLMSDALPVQQAAKLAYREARPDAWKEGDPVALAVHGFPESSYMYKDLLPALAEAGYRAVAPDLPGSGDSAPDRPATWERQMEALERFRSELGLDRVALIVHDWGGLIGLRWACDHPDAVAALVITNTGFFADGKWHDLAQAMRSEGQGEQLMEAFNRDLLATSLRQSSPDISDEAIDEYMKAFADQERRHSVLDLYRSGDFEKLAPYQGKLAELGVPTLILWGANDEYAPVAGAHRFAQEIPHAELVVLDGVGHFVWDEAPDRAIPATTNFLAKETPPATM